MPHQTFIAMKARRRLLSATAAAAFVGLALAGCAPGSASPANSDPAPVSTRIPSTPVDLNILVTTPDVPLFEALGKAFTSEHPNVTVDVASQDYTALTTNVAHVLSGTKAPDIVRLASFGNLVKDRLLTDLDPYAKAYGWTSWPQSQFDSTRVAQNGTERGSGKLYGVGPGFGLTGIFYDKALARRVGMTSAPTSLSQFEQLLSKAKKAGIQPFVSNGKDGGTAFLLQNLQMDYAGKSEVQDWTYNKPGATIDTPNTVKAARTLQQWAQDGYFAPDVNAVDQTQAPTQFASGAGLFFPSGNWQAPGLDKAGPGSFGFFLFPAAKEGGAVSAMTAADTLAIPSQAKQPAIAGAFLDFIQTDKRARQAAVDLGGIVPAGPADASLPTAESGSVVEGTVASFKELLKDDGLVDFMANATASINVNAIVPQTQLLVSGKTTPEDYAKALQAEYSRQVSK